MTWKQQQKKAALSFGQVSTKTIKEQRAGLPIGIAAGAGALFMHRQKSELRRLSGGAGSSRQGGGHTPEAPEPRRRRAASSRGEREVGASGDAVAVLAAERCIERLKNGKENSDVSFEISSCKCIIKYKKLNSSCGNAYHFVDAQRC